MVYLIIQGHCGTKVEELSGENCFYCRHTKHLWASFNFYSIFGNGSNAAGLSRECMVCLGHTLSSGFGLAFLLAVGLVDWHAILATPPPVEVKQPENIKKGENVFSTNYDPLSLT